jgi:hypothetical protein
MSNLYLSATGSSRRRINEGTNNRRRMSEGSQATTRSVEIPSKSMAIRSAEQHGERSQKWLRPTISNWFAHLSKSWPFNMTLIQLSNLSVKTTCSTIRPDFSGGVDAFKEMMSECMEGSRDESFVIDDIIAESDRVVTRWTASGCQTKDLPGIPNQGKCFKIGGISISRVSDGKISE